MSSRLLTFRELKSVKGWPHSRQYTSKLVKDGKIPAPKKRSGGGSINLWDEGEWDEYQSTFATDLTLTAMLINVLAANSDDAIVAGIGKLRTVIEGEGAVLSDIIVMLKQQPVRHDDREVHGHDDREVHGHDDREVHGQDDHDAHGAEAETNQ